jgi:phosphopantothenoylcysteine decarboxylase/phosphopantothenate--cysteine ligase
VRYLSNDSSGRMGYALAQSAHDAGHDVVLVSGPVHLAPPEGCQCIRVDTTEQMRDACVSRFSQCDGVIAAAAVCDYKPRNRVAGKISKTGGPITLEMIETDDVLAELGRLKGHRWVLGFALEAANARENGLQKLRAKNCDWIVLNAPAAIGSESNSVEVLDDSGRTLVSFAGSKAAVAGALIDWLGRTLAERR